MPRPAPATEVAADRPAAVAEYLVGNRDKPVLVYMAADRHHDRARANNQGVMRIHQCAAAGDRALFAGNQMSNSPLFPPIVVFDDGRVTPSPAEMSLADRNWS